MKQQIFAAAFLAPALISGAQAQSTKQPNVIVVLAGRKRYWL